MAAKLGVTGMRYGVDGKNHLRAAKDESNPYFTFDQSECIVCSRCVRACDEVQGTFALTIQGRGFGSKVSASQNESFLESECVSCGACVEACPTGALAEKSLIQIGQPTKVTTTTCAYCGVGCSFNAESRNGEVVRMVPNRDGHANHGHACVKGRFAYGYATHPDRITTPMIRKSIDDPWQQVTLGSGDRPRGERVQAHPGEVRPRLDRRHHLVALHERRDVPRAEAGAGRVRQQQRRHLRPRLPFADRLRPEEHHRRIRGHAELRLGHEGRRDHRRRREPDRRSPGVRVAHEAAPAAGREADRHRSARDRARQDAAHQGRPAPAAAARARTSRCSIRSRTSS